MTTTRRTRQGAAPDLPKMVNAFNAILAYFSMMVPVNKPISRDAY